MMNEIAQNDLSMIAEYLKEYSDLLSNQGCNDHWLPDTDANWELIRGMQRWNSSDSEEWDTREEITSDRGLFVPNFILPAYFADKIEKSLTASSIPKMYFAFDDDPGSDTPNVFLMVTQEFWEEHGHLDDQHLSATVFYTSGLPDGFCEVQESMFEYSGEVREGRKFLLAMGYQENKELLL